jgi:WD40 repeat protein
MLVVMPGDALSFQLFVSSTFKDFQVEREALRCHVYPKLQARCQARDATFETVDLRWGISAADAEDRQTMEICLDEVKRCALSTPRPNFLLLLGDRLGWRPLPAFLDDELFARLTRQLRASGASELLEGWYSICDKNAEPPARHLHLPHNYQPTDERRVVDAISAVTADMVLDPFLEARLAGGATEQETRRRLDLGPIDDGRAVVVIRQIEALLAGPSAADWRDVDPDGHLDDASAARLRSLRGDLRARAGQAVLSYTTGWQAGEPDQAYLRQLCADVHDRLAQAIDRELDDRDSRPAAAREEQSHHAFARDLAAKLSGRGPELDRIMRWANGPGGRALVVYGLSGSGKSSLLAAATQDPRFPHRSVVRFVGATHRSAAPQALTASLLAELRPDDKVPEAPDAVAENLAGLLEKWPGADPIVLVVDAVDQVGPDSVAEWLGVRLPRSVHLLLSVLDGPDRTRLGAMLPDAAWLEVPRLPAQDAAHALNAWLTAAHRTLQPQQQALVLEAFSRSGMPLHLRLLFERARTWTSSYEPTRLPGDASEALQQLFRDLEDEHGPVLVEAALTSLVTARDGLSAREIIEILATDPEVMEEFRERSPDSPRVDALPGVVWIRLYRGLEPYLTERDRPGGTTLGLFHRQVGAAIEGRWLTEPARRRCCHKRLAAYFASQPTWLDGGGSPAPNRRKLAELPYQYTMAGNRVAVEELLTDPGSLHALVGGLGPWELAEDLERAARMAPDSSLPVLRDAARAAAPVVAADPSLLPSQLLGRLPGTESAFRARISAGPWRSAWLEPLTSSLGHGELRFVLRGHDGTVRTLAISNDGRWCATAGNSHPDQTVRIWSLVTGENVQILPGLAEAGGRTPIAFDCQGNVLVGAGETVMSIEPLSWRQRELLDTGHKIVCLAAAAAAPVIAVGTSDRTLHLLGDQPRGRTVDPGRNPVAVAVSPSGRHVAVLGEDGLTTLDGQGIVRSQLAAAVEVGPGAPPWNNVPLAISDDGTVRFGRKLREWRPGSSTTADLLAPARGHVRAVLALSPDGTRALVSPYQEDTRDSANQPDVTGRVAGWTIGAEDTGPLTWDPGAFAASTGISADGQMGVVAYYDHEVRVWDLSRRAQPTAIGHDHRISNIDIRGDTAIVMDWGNVPSAWDLRTGARDDDRLPTGEELTAMMGPVTAAEPPPGVPAEHDEPARSANGHVVVAAPPPWLTQWTVAADAPVAVSYQVPSAKVSETLDPPDGHTPPLAPFDVWELDATGRPRRRRHTGYGGTYQVVTNRLTTVALTSDGSAAVAASYGSLRVFDLVTGRQRWRLEGHTRPVWTVDVVDDAGVAISGSEDSSVRIWDLTQGSQIAAFQGESPIRVVRGTVVDGTVIAVAGEISGRVHILRLRDN